MAGGKETPRQKMIGMMYLVLTALLALNVSKEILDAFKIVDNGLQVTEASLNGKNESAMNAFENKSKANPQKTEPFLKAARKVAKAGDDLVEHIEILKARTISVSVNGNVKARAENEYSQYLFDGKAVSLGQLDPDGNEYIQKPDENTEVTSLLIGPNSENPRVDEWSAGELKAKLLAFKDELKAVRVKDVTGKEWKVPASISENLDLVFNYPDEMEDGVEVQWENKNFGGNPIAAILPIMTKLQVDIQNASSDMISALLAGVEGESFKFTTLEPMVIPQSSYVLRGDTFRAKVFLAAYDATNAPEIYIDQKDWDRKDSSIYANTPQDVALEFDEKGFGILKIPTKGAALGDHAFKGLIRYKGPDGKPIPFAVYSEPYTVAEPSLVISPTKMNVFYRGLPNPVEISVPGYPLDKIQATCAGHSLSKSGSEWIIKPGKGKDAKISVSVTDDNGNRVNMGSKDFRVKRIPDPTPKFAGKKPSDNTVPKKEMVIATGIRAEMENFDFDVTVKVKSFNMVFIRDGRVIEKSSNSNRITEEMTANMKKVKKGEKVYIEKVMVSMPDGSTRQVSNISLKVT